MSKQINHKNQKKESSDFQSNEDNSSTTSSVSSMTALEEDEFSYIKSAFEFEYPISLSEIEDDYQLDSHIFPYNSQNLNSKILSGLFSVILDDKSVAWPPEAVGHITQKEMLLRAHKTEQFNLSRLNDIISIDNFCNQHFIREKRILKGPKIRHISSSKLPCDPSFINGFSNPGTRNLILSTSFTDIFDIPNNSKNSSMTLHVNSNCYYDPETGLPFKSTDEFMRMRLAQNSTSATYDTTF